MTLILLAAWFTLNLITLCLAWIFDRKINPKPPKRACKNCYHLLGYSNGLFCAKLNGMRTENNNFCASFHPYTWPTEKEVVQSYLERCFKE